MAVSANKGNGPGHQHLMLHTVLGPELDANTVRLEQMLRCLRPTGRSEEYTTGVPPMFGLRVHRLYSQDFMSLATRETLFR